MFHWKDWRYFIYTMLGKSCHHQHDDLCTLPPGSPVVYPIVHNADMNKIAKSKAIEPIKIVHNDSKVSLEPFRRQFALTIPGKIKRDTSYGSTHSNMSAEQIQNQHDMLQLSDQPLSLEDMATIVSGSLSLVNGDNSSDEDEKELKYLAEGVNDTITNNACNTVLANWVGSSFASRQKDNSSETASVDSATLVVFAEKKKQLKEKLQERNATYCKTKAHNDQKAAILESDAAEIDGLQVFRNSYNMWKQQGRKTRSSFPSPIVVKSLTSTANETGVSSSITSSITSIRY